MMNLKDIAKAFISQNFDLIFSERFVLIFCKIVSKGVIVKRNYAHCNKGMPP